MKPSKTEKVTAWAIKLPSKVTKLLPSTPIASNSGGGTSLSENRYRLMAKSGIGYKRTVKIHVTEDGRPVYKVPELQKGYWVFKDNTDTAYTHVAFLWSMEEPIAQFPQSHWLPEDMFAGDGYPPVSHTFGLGGKDGLTIRLKEATPKQNAPQIDIALSTHWAEVQLQNLFDPNQNPDGSTFQPMTSRIGIMVDYELFTEAVVKKLFGDYTCRVEIYKLEEGERLHQYQRLPRHTAKTMNLDALDPPDKRTHSSDDTVAKDKVRVIKNINGCTVLFLACLAVENENAAAKLLYMVDVGSIIGQDLVDHSMGSYIPKRTLRAAINLFRFLAPDIDSQHDVDIRCHQLFSLLFQHLCATKSYPTSSIASQPCSAASQQLRMVMSQIMMDMSEVFTFDQEAIWYGTKAHQCGSFIGRKSKSRPVTRNLGERTLTPMPSGRHPFKDPRQNKVMGQMYGAIIGAILTQSLGMIKKLRRKTDRQVFGADLTFSVAQDFVTLVSAAMRVPIPSSKTVDVFGERLRKRIVAKGEDKVAQHCAVLRNLKIMVDDEFHRIGKIFGPHIRVESFKSQALYAVGYAIQLQSSSESVDPTRLCMEIGIDQSTLRINDWDTRVQTYDVNASYQVMWYILSGQTRVVQLPAPHFMVKRKDSFIKRYTSTSSTSARIYGNARQFFVWLNATTTSTTANQIRYGSSRLPPLRHLASQAAIRYSSAAPLPSASSTAAAVSPPLIGPDAGVLVPPGFTTPPVTTATVPPESHTATADPPNSSTLTAIVVPPIPLAHPVADVNMVVPLASNAAPRWIVGVLLATLVGIVVALLMPSARNTKPQAFVPAVHVAVPTVDTIEMVLPVLVVPDSQAVSSPVFPTIPDGGTWYVLATRAFRASPGSSNTLSFREGDVLQVLERHDDEWVTAVCRGKIAFARLEHLKRWQVAALRDFEAGPSIKITKGDILDVVDGSLEESTLVIRTKNNRKGLVDKSDAVDVQNECGFVTKVVREKICWHWIGAMGAGRGTAGPKRDQVSGEGTRAESVPPLALLGYE